MKNHFKEAEHLLADERLEAEKDLVELLDEQRKIKDEEKTNQLEIQRYESRVSTENKQIDIIQQTIDSTEAQIK